MPYNGSGVFTLVTGNPVVTGTTISSTVQNNTMSDIVNSGLTFAITKDGQQTPTANLPMGAFKHTNVGAAVNSTDYARYDQVVKASGGTMTGGTIDSTVIGGTTPAAGSFTSLNGGAIRGRTNYLINGGAEVAQASSVNISTSAQYGQVDQCTLWASGGAVGAGTIIQTTSATVGRTGYAARASGVTLTGSGQISWRSRIESRDAINLKSQTASFQIAVMHNVGSTINYTIIIRKPTATDNYSSTTVISTGSATPVTTGTATALTLPNVSMGDCSNGIEIEVQAACGAITTKNFDFTEWQLEEGPVCTTFERREYDDELRKCQWFYRKSGAVALGEAFSTTGADLFFPYPEMRIAPTPNALNSTPTLRVAGSTSAIAGTWTSLTATTKGALVQFVRTAGTWTAGNSVNLNDSTDALEFVSRL